MILENLGFYVEKNFERVNNLMEIYEIITPKKKGRKPVKSLDLLRVTVVLLHASLEDYLRSLMKTLLPIANKEYLKGIPLFLNQNEYRKTTKFELGELAEHRDLTVDSLISLSVEQYLNRESYNNTNEIASALERIGFAITPEMTNLLNDLDKMIARRHNIVHQTDRELKDGQGFHEAKSINYKQVKKWRNVVDKFMAEIVNQY